MRQAKVGHAPHLPAHLPPAPTERIILAVPHALVCAVVEQIHIALAALRVVATQLGVRLADQLDRRRRDLQKPRRDILHQHSAVSPRTRLAAVSRDDVPHVVAGIVFEPIGAADHMTWRLN